MSWSQLNKSINAHSVMALDAHSCRDYGISLSFTFPFDKVRFTCQALAMLSQLNDFDQKMVEKDIKQICHHPNAKNALKHSRNPFKRIWRTQYPFRNYHFLLEYTYKDNQINIEEIFFDRQLSGPKTNFAAERSMLYQVNRKTMATYNKAQDKDKIGELEGAWDDDPQPSAQVRTNHAAVNGMQNQLTKAAWLMGTHLDAAYQTDTIKAYTLFHNPTDNIALDGIECVFDKRLGQKSHNAQHLAAVLAQNNQQGKQVKWVAHSQGAIIFCAALEHYRIKYGKPLTTQQLAVHGSGANLDRLKQVAQNTGLTINSVRNNPYDLVPSVAGRNDLSASSLARAYKFRGLVFGDEVAASPHTLPFLGLETYADQLQLLGEDKKAIIVRKFIQSLPAGDNRI